MNLWHIAPNRIVGVIEAIIAVAISFGLDWTPEQVGAIIAALTLIGGVIGDATTASRAALRQLADSQT